MKKLRIIVRITLLGIVALKLAGCKAVEEESNWKAFNNQLGKASTFSKNLRYYDDKDSNFFRMNIYWRQIEITPDPKK